jgi:hypothetical protein
VEAQLEQPENFFQLLQEGVGRTAGKAENLYSGYDELTVLSIKKGGIFQESYL